MYLSSRLFFCHKIFVINLTQAFDCRKNLFNDNRNSVKTHVIPILTLFYEKLKLFMKILFQTLSLPHMPLKGIEFKR
jgi:hypothetical protein